MRAGIFLGLVILILEKMQLMEPILLASFKEGEWTCFRGWAYFGYI